MRAHVRGGLRVFRRDRAFYYKGFPLLLRLLVLVLVVGLGLLAIIGTTERLARTAMVSAHVVSYDWPSKPYLNIPAGHEIRYTFEVDGREYSSTAIRSWTLLAAQSAQCFDPRDPANNVLVLEGDSCQ